jgi:hypothetical protein
MRELMLSFADRHLSPYTLRGDELIPDYCPICHGGDNRDRYTFALNLTEGIYVCKRGSCGARGRFEELARRFGEQAEIIRPPGRMRMFRNACRSSLGRGGFFMLGGWGG